MVIVMDDTGPAVHCVRNNNGRRACGGGQPWSALEWWQALKHHSVARAPSQSSLSLSHSIYHRCPVPVPSPKNCQNGPLYTQRRALRTHLIPRSLNDDVSRGTTNALSRHSPLRSPFAWPLSSQQPELCPLSCKRARRLPPPLRCRLPKDSYPVSHQRPPRRLL